jgi:RNA polymerase sigma factor (sigma-70 family)
MTALSPALSPALSSALSSAVVPIVVPSPALPVETPAPSDHLLMQQYASGQVAAFEELYTRHALSVWRYVFRSVRNAAVADDLLQDVWFAVARQAAKYQSTARFKTWLFTLAHHRKVDYFRTAKHHASLDESCADDITLADTLAADSGFGPVRQLQSREQGAALIAAIEQLPPGQRDAFLLQAEGDLSVEDIAAACGVSFETAKSRLRYARHRLRELLQDFA